MASLRVKPPEENSDLKRITKWIFQNLFLSSVYSEHI